MVLVVGDPEVHGIRLAENRPGHHHGLEMQAAESPQFGGDGFTVYEFDGRSVKGVVENEIQAVNIPWLHARKIEIAGMEISRDNVMGSHRHGLVFTRA